MNGVKKLSGLLLCVILLSLLFVPACGQNVEDEQITFLVGVSQANLIDPWQIALKDDIELQAAQYEDIKVIYADAGSSNEKQESDISDMVVQQVDLIIIFPNDVDYISGVLQEIHTSGTDIILLGYPPDAQCYSTRIYTDNEKIGNMAGDYARQLLGESGVVLELQGDPDNPMSIARKQGFLDAIAPYKRIVKEYVAVGYWSRDNAEYVLGNSGLLDRELGVDLVFAHNDEMAIGANKLIESKGMDVFVIGVDGLHGNNRGIEAVREGKIDGTITYPTGGKEAIAYAVKLLNGDEVPCEIELQAQLITVENVEDF